MISTLYKFNRYGLSCEIGPSFLNVHLVQSVS